MADITLHTKKETGFTCISNAFIDNYMKDANGEYVKVYLYLLRLLSSENVEFDLDKVAEKLEHTEKDINRALKYWDKLGLIQLEYSSKGELIGICFTDVLDDRTISSSSAISTTTSSIEDKAPATINNHNTKQMYSVDQLSLFQSSEETKELLFIIEKLLGRTLKVTDINTILSWSEGLNFSEELIEYLVEYCVSNNHCEMPYIDKVASSWYEHGITSVQDAKDLSSAFSKKYFSVMKFFGINGRSLIDSEKVYVDRWIDTYGFDFDLIDEACRRTIANISKPNFEYANAILTNWYNHDISDIQGVEALEASITAQRKSSNKKAVKKSTKTVSNFNERTYDYDSLEKKLLQQ